MGSIRKTRTDVAPEELTTARTLTAAETGITLISKAVDLVVTLPAVQSGLTYRLVTETLSVTTGFSLSPAAADKIEGLGITAAVDKDLINTGSSDAAGDFIEVIGNAAEDGWWVVGSRGTWAREA